MHRWNNWYFITAVLVTALVAGYCVADWAMQPRVPVLEVDKRSQRVETSPSAKVRAVYRLTNRGTGDLILGQASTSCGCSVASVSAKTVAPGDTATLVVEANSIPAGEREVHVSIETNLPERVLNLSLTLVGYKMPPFVVNSSSPVQFGVIESNTSSEEILIVTREPAGKPWITGVVSSIPGLLIEGGLKSESNFGEKVVAREYRYVAELQRIPGPGDVIGEIQFISGQDSAPCLALSVHGIVRADAYAVPKALYASIAGGETPEFALTIKCGPGKSDLTVKPSTPTLQSFEVREIERSSRHVSFKIVPRGSIVSSLTADLVFSTNLPTCQTVSVPMRVRRVD